MPGRGLVFLAFMTGQSTRPSPTRVRQTSRRRRWNSDSCGCPGAPARRRAGTATRPRAPASPRRRRRQAADEPRRGTRLISPGLLRSTRVYHLATILPLNAQNKKWSVVFSQTAIPDRAAHFRLRNHEPTLHAACHPEIMEAAVCLSKVEHSMNFSMRMGLEPAVRPIQRDSMDDAPRNSLWNEFDRLILEDPGPGCRCRPTRPIGGRVVPCPCRVRCQLCESPSSRRTEPRSGRAHPDRARRQHRPAERRCFAAH
jgi:hypothetical protein